MRILVTGITGQVGSAIARRFASFARVVPADRTVLDLARPEGLSQRLEELAPDIIINPAGYTAVDRAEDDRSNAFLVNATSPGVVAQWAAARRVPFVHFSTDYVFDGSGERPWREEDPAKPLSVYGASKLAGEEAIESAGGCYLIIRTQWIYSAGGMNFMRKIVELMREHQELSIVADQFGAPTSAAFIAKALAHLVAANLNDLPSAFASTKNKLHLAAGGTTSWYGFAKQILTGLKNRNVQIETRRLIPVAANNYPMRAARPLNSRLDLSRLTDIFQIQPPLWSTLVDAELDQLVACQQVASPGTS